MFDERAALQLLFMGLDKARERRYQQHVEEMADIDRRMIVLIDTIRRLDEDERINRQAEPVVAETKERLAAMEQNIVAPIHGIKSEKIKMDDLTIKRSGGVVPKPSKPSEDIPKPSEPEQKPREMGKPVVDHDKGIKTHPDGREEYQLYYVCPSCRDKGKRYIDKSSLETFCRSCNKTMKVDKATSNGFPNRDSFGNYFIAGNFTRTEDFEPAPLLPPNPVDQLLAKYEAERQAENGPIADALKKAVKS